ncbi:hypothetical protein [Microlunatus soli]|uniref:Lipoprotein n=1 Tax=Microlunatus soli TaxID=630515 RepID=A0A1H1VCQ4_9ACTN|nr:hypothetical protein [Microlunatus soli]SDS82562.1 hypothetical protein SAMN04489812_3158 [Microlunatus soli]
MSGQAFRPPFRFASLRMALAGTAAAGLLTLAACTGSTGSGEDAAPDSGSSAPASSAPASSAPASSAPASSAPASSDSDEGDSTGKPTKDELVAGLVKYYASTGVTGAAADKTAACLADKIYGTMSADALKSLAEGKLDGSALTGGDAQAFANASGACVKEMTGGGS